MSTFTKHQRRLVLLVVLVLVLIGAPAIIKMVSSPRPVPAVTPSLTTEVTQTPTSRSLDVVPDEVIQEKPIEKTPVQETIVQAEPGLQADNSQAPETAAATTTGTTKQPEQVSDTALVEHAREFVAGNWVVVDCERRVVLQCPHKLIAPKASPDLSPKVGKKKWQGRCRDVSIKFDSFCWN